MAAANAFGIDVSGLDVASFLAVARTVYAVLGVAFAFALLKARHPRWLLFGVLAANAWAWFETSYPLQRLYALGPSFDRVGNLALCQVVAAGHSPLRTAQVGQLHFEPFWGLLTALLSLWSPDRLLALYPFLSLVLVCGFAVSLYYALPAASGWERALGAGFATLLASSCLDFTGVYRVPWALTFLLKPNHALGLLLFPLVLRAFAGITRTRDRLLVGLFLHLLGWVFVLHMVYLCFGLLVFAALNWRGPDRRRATLDVAVVIGVNLLVVSPYLIILAVGYPILWPGPQMAIPPASSHLLEPTFRSGVLFPLALWALLRLYRRGDRIGQVWLAQAIGAGLLWLSYFALSPLELAKERDELDYWLRFLTAALAALGAWDLLGRLGPLLTAPARRAAALCLLALPYSLPYWWDPLQMDAYFPGSIPPLEERVRAPTDYLRQQTDPSAVVAGDHDFARWVAALGARRVLRADSFHGPSDYEDRDRLEEALIRHGTEADLLAAQRDYGVVYLLVTPAVLAENPGVTLATLDGRAGFRQVHMTGDPAGDFVAIYRLGPA